MERNENSRNERITRRVKTPKNRGEGSSKSKKHNSKEESANSGSNGLQGIEQMKCILATMKMNLTQMKFYRWLLSNYKCDRREYVPTIYEKQTHKSWIVAWERLFHKDGSTNDEGDGKGKVIFKAPLSRQRTFKIGINVVDKKA
ncbi:hypothetical protein MTR_8g059160 [Medicago truncatula]|uniref:Uncharacterized protein n=1 Tax=Medicago truncatula TaxID=3880 RepID=A0A072TPM3_MEDTR|nr:hypothetical protein MTR_8g059160 [Medicago truncatula]